jgi:hypothetical protein
MDISLKSHMTAYAPGCKSSFRGLFHQDHRFPEGTHGFLYYNEPKAGAPPAAGDLRFRVTPGNTPASFVQGSDLLRPTGLPWSTPLLAMVEKPESVHTNEQYQPILQLLLEDGFVTPTLLETCATMANSSRPQPVRGSRIIHSFGQLFHITFEASEFRFFALSMNQLQYKCRRIYYKNTKFLPYSGEYTKIAQFIPILLKSQPPGSALCCFERSNLPQHQGTRTVVIRIVKIISPVTCRYPDYDGRVPLPVEGELVQRRYLQKGLQPVSFNVDLERYTELQMLFRDES